MKYVALEPDGPLLPKRIRALRSWEGRGPGFALTADAGGLLSRSINLGVRGSIGVDAGGTLSRRIVLRVRGALDEDVSGSL